MSRPLTFRLKLVFVISTSLLASSLKSCHCTAFDCSVSARAAASPPDSSNTLREIIGSGHLVDLRWPDFSDYRRQLQSFYEPSSYTEAWVKNGRPTPQALAVVATFQAAAGRGLNPEDYDGPRWKERLARLSQPEDLVRFEVAVSVCAVRYVSDLHIGRVNPKHFGFGLSTSNKKYDLPQFLRERVAGAPDAAAAIEEAEPSFPGYQRTLGALEHYLQLARQDDGEKLPAPTKPVEPGGQYAGLARLTRLLALLGDLPSDVNASQSVDNYAGPVVAAVKRFQQRHGLISDGRLGAQTVNQLNVPLIRRVEQLRLTLERWRWLPQEFPEPPVVVNIPEFRLRAFDEAGKLVLSTNVVVGRALRHETPVFDNDMRYVVFRPYWNVPPGIQRSEIVPAIRKDREYVVKHKYEVITHRGEVVTGGTISDEVLEQLRTGKLAIRQRPGPNNALGLVKLMFPNEYSVYLHSTPAPQLFAKSRRDFSHGCIRVERVDELAAWALRKNSGWDSERVRAAMKSGSDDVQVNLAKPVPVLILYGTAVVDESGAVHFFDDIYGHDAELEQALAKGYPYPHSGTLVTSLMPLQGREHHARR